MVSLLSRSQWRHWWRHPWLLLLSLLGVAMGVGGIVAMELSIGSCRRAFELSQQQLSGPTTHWIVGGQRGLPETLYRKLRIERGLRKCAPVVEGFLTWDDGKRRESLRLLGLDPIAEGPFRGAWLQGSSGKGPPLIQLLAGPGSLAMSRGEAKRLGLQLNQVMPLKAPGEMRLRATLDGLSPSREQALQGQLLCDLSVAQEALGMQGALSRIELILEPDEVDGLAAWLPAEVALVPAATRTQTMNQMSEAFFLNLQALSLLSLLVGSFLIYNTIHFMVMQRRPWMGRLRILGVTSREIRSQVLLEAAWIGALGSLLGALLGIALSRQLLPLLTRTINDLYYNLQVQQSHLSALSLAKGLWAGWICALAAAWWPAREAGATSPLVVLQSSPMEAQSLRGWLRGSGWAVLALALSWAVLELADSNLGLNLVAMFGLIFSSAALTPAFVLGVQRLLLKLTRGYHPGLHLILGGLRRSLSRMGVALMAMTLALSAVLSITVMVHSFRISLLSWLDRTLQFDLYIGQVDRQAARAGQGLPRQVVEALGRHPDVAHMVMLKMGPVYWRQPAMSSQVMAWKLGQLAAQPLEPASLKAYRMLSGRPPSPGLPELMASEPFARKNNLSVGEKLQLQTRSGPLDLTVAGVFQDYASDTGYLVMDLTRYRRHFLDDSVTGVGLMARPGRTESLRREILSAPGAELLEVRSQRALHALSVEIFEQTFLVTRALSLLAMLVAATGIVSSVAAHRLERRREMALWGALGWTRRQRWGLFWSESALAALLAGLAAWPCGLLQAYAMVQFINRRAFGWTLEFHPHWGAMLTTPLLAVLAASLAVALAPPSRRPLAEDLRTE
jgi:putative ABC transport system permease protein